MITVPYGLLLLRYLRIIRIVLLLRYCYCATTALYRVSCVGVWLWCNPLVGASVLPRRHKQTARTTSSTSPTTSTPQLRLLRAQLSHNTTTTI